MKRSICYLRAVTVSLLVCTTIACQPAPETSPVAQAVPPEASQYEQGRKLLFNARDRYQYAEAVTMLSEAVANDPGNPSAHFALAYAYLKRGNYDNAGQQIALARESEAELSEQDRLWLPALAARVADDAQAEAEAWSNVVATFPDDRWAWYELASAQISSENFEASAKAAEAALEAEPDPAKWEASWIYYLQSKALFRGGYPKQAAAAAAKGLANTTTWRSTFFRMALGLAASGEADRVDEFVQTYRDISQSEGRNNPPMTETNISLFYYELGLYDKAAAHAQAALKLAPGAYQSWALGYALIEDGQPAEALEAIATGLASKPDDVYLNAARGWALYRLGRLEEAEEALLHAQRVSKRINRRVEQDLATVRAALAGTETEPAPKIPWLG